jgi:hypothetical protein
MRWSGWLRRISNPPIGQASGLWIEIRDYAAAYCDNSIAV